MNPHIDLIKEKVASSKEVTFHVQTNSMSPIIIPGDLVNVKPIKLADDLNIFDIILFEANQKMYCHYILQKQRVHYPEERYFFVTKGINNKREDTPIYFKQVIGRVTNFKISFSRRILELFKVKLL